MAVSAKTEFDVAAPPSVVMEVLMDVEALPDWSGPHREAQILTEHADGTPEQVRIVVHEGPISDEQTLSYTWTENTCTWTLVEAHHLKEQNGLYVVTETETGSRVEFTLEIDLKIKLPGLLVKRAQKIAVDTAKKGLTAESERRAAG
ncbi:SRPBCC family protein [Gordonia rhizosphera]|uniref:Coenzyme Q-binding protein COQ10 START domain-containing protein n=1 Tax=Gordonia rhizosphera NBRC 16068 TaxID=1108045 RepID=K6VPY6_9ACTN|nr:SRPBCC family protein [Gordonia rhizosphera]GAB88970.1 hypothetical protein GORHZ_046_01210 [Gordonia rhizosphera NBRC 16068]